MVLESGVSPFGNESGTKEGPFTPQYAHLDVEPGQWHRASGLSLIHAHTGKSKMHPGAHPDTTLVKHGFPHLHFETEENIPGNDPRPAKDLETKRHDEISGKGSNRSDAKPAPTQVMELTDLEKGDAGRLYGLHDMQFRASDQNKLDALAYIPKGFDSAKPFNLVVHVHGWWKDLRQCWQFYQIGEQLQKVDPQTIVIMPAWQQLNGNGGKSDSSSQGGLLKPGAYSKMLQETFDKTPGLKGTGLKLDQVNQITVVSHSAGYVPTGRLIQDLGGKIATLAMLDSPRSKAVDQWVEQNKGALEKGEKQYFDVFNTYRDGGLGQLKDLWGSHPPSVSACTDAKKMTVANKDKDEADLGKCSIVYLDSPTTHFIIPQKYLGTVIDLSDQLRKQK